ncbi:hypothetical protein LWI28_026971 [Acer negundo]|uniref:RING-type E3 ubiquitin transferase n=1 Tax=Acer negundo TaxID=4023 RepID=A0AAD5JR84_ACENE|nr:hypothetical protein LWI28_026971 [Acer negundo]
MYERACEELVHAQNKVQLLSKECHEEARRVDAALDRKETLSKIAAEEKAKHLQALKEVEDAKDLLVKETYGREVAELNARKESSEKQQIIDALISSDLRYRRYSREELEAATDFFSENNVIGEGGYGKVYKCNLDHTPVAVKVLWPDAINKKDEFLKEVEVLSQIRHPHMVLLLGACPERLLDNSVTDWPLAEVEELARIAVKCSNLRCRDRPDLDNEVLPVLKRLKDVAELALRKTEKDNIYAPSHFFCPILQDVMEDPYIAADGFTYEHRAIKAWQEKETQRITSDKA